MQKNMETEQLRGISALHQQKKPFAIGGLVNKNWKKWLFSGILKVSSVLRTKVPEPNNAMYTNNANTQSLKNHCRWKKVTCSVL